MAGDWIKLEVATIDKPEVIEMSDLLETTPEEVFGMLFRVWAWFDSQSRDGHAGNVTGITLQKFIDSLVGRQGFAGCMKKVGWLTDVGMPNFDKHNGKSAKNRALARDRKARERAEEVTKESRNDRDKNGTREEKMLKEKEGDSVAGAIFGDGLKILTSAGTTEKAARTFLGMCLSKWADTDVRDALLQSAGKVDPVSYARKILGTKPEKPKPPAGSDAVLARLREKHPSIRLATDGKAFFDPPTQNRYSLTGERLSGA